MSRKSRQPKAEPEAAGSKKKKKGSKAKKSSPGGTSYLVILAVATVLASPALMQFSAGQRSFDDTMTRFFFALVVAWGLVLLVQTVYASMRPTAPAEPELPPGDFGHV